MEKKMPMDFSYERSARRRLSNISVATATAAAAIQLQQQQLLPKLSNQPHKPAIKSRQTAKTKTKLVETHKKQRPVAGTAAVLPPIRQWNNSNILPGSSSKRCSMARIMQQPLPHARSNMPQRAGSTAKLSASSSRPMRAAHEQLERLLAGFEQGSETGATAAAAARTTTTTSPAPAKRRKRAGAKLARRQSQSQPPVPAASPQISVRCKHTPQVEQLQLLPAAATVAANSEQTYVPLTVSPQMLAPEKRFALLELLSRAEQSEQDIIKILQSELSEYTDPGKAAKGLALQGLPLALMPGKSPYCEGRWMEQKEQQQQQKQQQQKQQQQLQQLPLLPSIDLRHRDVKLFTTSTGHSLLPLNLEQELNDNLSVAEYVNAQLQRSKLAAMSPEQRARQQQAFDERIELDRQKQEMSELRSRHREETHDMRHKLMLQKLQLTKPKETQAYDAAYIEQSIFMGNQEEVYLPETADAFTHYTEYNKDVKDALRQRQLYQEQCKCSSLYNNSLCMAPWSLFASISDKLSLGVKENIEHELHRNIASFIKDNLSSKNRQTMPQN